jgi:membrane-associated phospholipid phosphatase
VPVWQQASLLFFVYIALVAMLPRYRQAGRTMAVWTGAAAGLAVTLLVASIGHVPLIHDWVAAPVLLLTGYWVSGRLFQSPSARQERILTEPDERLRIRGIAARTPRWIAELLELAYVGIYALVLLALALHFVFATVPDSSRFWSVILLTDYICFGALPWVQTRPPRAIEQGEPWTSTVRRFNLRLMNAASVQANTFPSGHAAEAVAAALMTLDAPWPIAILMWTSALVVSVGAILGRYHYVADVLVGWLVALSVWMSLWP